MNDSMNYSVFKGLFDQAFIGMVISNDQGIIENINPFCAAMFGYETGELMGKNIDLLVPTELREKHIGQRESYYDNPVPKAMGAGRDLLAQKKNGVRFHVEVSLSHYFLNNKLHVVSIVNDISIREKLKNDLTTQALTLELKVQERTQELTQALMEINHSKEVLEKEIERRKESEAKVREALEKQTELNELKSRFVSTASHEFRTPLAGILTSVSLLAKYNTPETQERRKKHIKTIKKSVRYLTSVLNDFLSLDKLDENKTGARPRDFDMVSLVKETISDIKEMADDNYPITFSPERPEMKIYQDADMLRNILVNLISNAVKYSESGSPIKIRCQTHDGTVSLAVEDQGFGIPKENQKHLFERFFRADNVTTIQGTGLGLNIVKKYLEFMQGDITFTSEEGVGTTFNVTFPMEIKK